LTFSRSISPSTEIESEETRSSCLAAVMRAAERAPRKAREGGVDDADEGVE
jgi:hypothetical protein